MFCPNCGTNVPDGGKFCPTCGHTMQSSAGSGEIRYASSKAEPVCPPPVQSEPMYTPPAPPASSSLRKKAKKNLKLPLIIVVVVAIVAIVVASISLLDSKESFCVAYEDKASYPDYEKSSSYEYEFDDDGNLEVYWRESSSNADGDDYSQGSEFEVEYDDMGNIETVTYDNGYVKYEFEYIYEDKELVEVVCEDGDITYTATFEDGKVVSVEQSYGDASRERASYEYDGDVLLEKVVDNGYVKYVYVFNQDGKVTTLKSYIDDELNFSLTYEYNDEGDIIEQIGTIYSDGEKTTTTTTYEYTYGKGGRVENIIITTDDGKTTQEVEQVYEWESDTKATITYEGDDAEEMYGEDYYVEIETDKDGNVIHEVTYKDGEQINEVTRTYQRLTKQQQEQLDQFRWLLDLFWS